MSSRRPPEDPDEPGRAATPGHGAGKPTTGSYEMGAPPPPAAGGQDAGPGFTRERGISAYRRKLEEERGGAPAEPGPPRAPRALPAPVPAVVPARPGRRAAPVTPSRGAEAPAPRRRVLDATPLAATPPHPEEPAAGPSWLRRHPDLASSVALFVVGFLLVASTWGGVGWSWDEAFYLPPARLARQWAGGLLGAGFPDGGALSAPVMERHWGPTEVVGNQPFINELPALTKWAWALGLTLFEASLGPMTAMRLPTALFFALTLVVIYHLCRLVTPPMSALFAAACFAAMPRVFGHAHLATTEMPMALLGAATTYAFARGLSTRAWAVAAGVLFGLALATKVNAFFLFPGLFLWAWVFHRDRLGHPVGTMIFLAPIIFVLSWPWLWHDTIPRILEYLAYHAHNESRGLYYDGRTYGGAAWDGAAFVPRPNAPWTYPFVMILLTTPPAILLFLAIGLIRVVVARGCAVGWLMVMQAAVPILVIAVPGQPKYDGIRLFFPAYPFLAVLCGFGIGGILRQFSPDPARADDDPLRERALARVWWALALAAWLVLGVSGVRALASHHPLHLSYYNRFVGGGGGVRGAWDGGHEVTYWVEALNLDVVAWLNGNIPGGSHVKTRALHVEVLRQYQEWGLLRKDIGFDDLPAEGDTPPEYDFHLIGARRGFWGEFDWMMYSRFGDRALHTVTHRGAPMLFVWGALGDLGVGERRIQARLGKDPDASPPPEW